MFFHLFVRVQESITPLLPPPIRITPTTAIRLRDCCAIYILPPTLPSYAIHHTILVKAISCKGQYTHAACSAGPPPWLSIGTSASTPLAAAMARLLSACAARFISAPAASSWTPGVPFERSATSGLTAPAASIASMFAGCWTRNKGSNQINIHIYICI